MFSDPHPGWFVLCIVLVMVSAANGEGVPLGSAVLSTVVLFGLWRLALAAFDNLRH